MRKRRGKPVGLRRLTDSEEFAVLCRKPYQLTLEQYLDLDDWQIVNVYFRPPTAEAAKKGFYWPMPPAMCTDDLEATRRCYFKVGKECNAPLDVIRRGWRHYKLVLLYGIEGQTVPWESAAKKVLTERGDKPSEIKKVLLERQQRVARVKKGKPIETHG